MFIEEHVLIFLKLTCHKIAVLLIFRKKCVKFHLEKIFKLLLGYRKISFLLVSENGIDEILVRLYTIFALIDHSPVGRIHSEEWA